MTRSQTCRYCLLKTLTALKCIYIVKRSPSLYRVKKFLPYSMWDITKHYLCRHNILIVSHEIVGLNKHTPHLHSKQTIFTRLDVDCYKWYQSQSPTLMWGFIWPRKGCLSIWPHNPMRHNEDVVSTLRGVCDVLDKIKKESS